MEPSCQQSKLPILSAVELVKSVTDALIELNNKMSIGIGAMMNLSEPLCFPNEHDTFHHIIYS